MGGGAALGVGLSGVSLPCCFSFFFFALGGCNFLEATASSRGWFAVCFGGGGCVRGSSGR